MNRVSALGAFAASALLLSACNATGVDEKTDVTSETSSARVINNVQQTQPFGSKFVWGIEWGFFPGGGAEKYASFDIAYYFPYPTSKEWDSNKKVWTYCRLGYMARVLKDVKTMPMITTYIATAYAREKLGNVGDCNEDPMGVLCKEGSKVLKDPANTAEILRRYASYAKQVNDSAPGKKTAWNLEGDFMQFLETTQSDPMTPAQSAKYLDDIINAIRQNNPNALIGVNTSFWKTEDLLYNYLTALKKENVDYIWLRGEFDVDYLDPTMQSKTAQTFTWIRRVSNLPIFTEGFKSWDIGTAAQINNRITVGGVVGTFMEGKYYAPRTFEQVAANVTALRGKLVSIPTQFDKRNPTVVAFDTARATMSATSAVVNQTIMSRLSTTLQVNDSDGYVTKGGLYLSNDEDGSEFFLGNFPRAATDRFGSWMQRTFVNLPVGTSTVFAKITDNEGRVTKSAPIDVYVSEVPYQLNAVRKFQMTGSVKTPKIVVKYKLPNEDNSGMDSLKFVIKNKTGKILWWRRVDMKSIGFTSTDRRIWIENQEFIDQYLPKLQNAGYTLEMLYHNDEYGPGKYLRLHKMPIDLFTETSL